MTPVQLARIRALETPDGEMYAASIVADATPTDSVLHALLPWDDAKLGHAARLDVARRLIRIRYLKHDTETLLVAAPHYVRDPSKPGNEPGYVSVAVLRTDEERARQAVRRECASAEAALSRAHAVAASLGLQDEILDLLTRLAKLKATLEPVVVLVDADEDDGPSSEPPAATL